MIQDIITQMLQVNSLFLIIIFVAFIVIAYKIFKLVMEAVIIGVLSAAFPFIANYLGIASVPITIDSVLWYGVMGIAIFFIYSSINGLVKVVGFFLSPFKGLFGEKDKKKVKERVIIREVPAKEKDKKEHSNDKDD